MQKALGVSNGQGPAIKRISGDMEKLLTSDVLYSARVAPLITQALASAGVAGSPPPTDSFLPDIGWLVPQTAAQHILSYVPTSLGGSPPVSGTLVGHRLISASVVTNGSAKTLQANGINSIPYTTAGVTFVLTFTNSGAVTEHDVGTEVTFSKAGLDTSCLTRTAIDPHDQPGRQLHLRHPLHADLLGPARPSSIRSWR